MNPIKLQLEMAYTDNPDTWEFTPEDNPIPIVYWWDDMRPKEVRQALIDAFERGFRYGVLYKNRREMSSDKIDELEQAIQFLRHENEELRNQQKSWQPHEDPGRTAYVVRIERENKELKSRLQKRERRITMKETDGVSLVNDDTPDEY